MAGSAAASGPVGRAAPVDVALHAAREVGLAAQRLAHAEVVEHDAAVPRRAFPRHALVLHNRNVVTLRVVRPVSYTHLTLPTNREV